MFLDGLKASFSDVMRPNKYKVYFHFPGVDSSEGGESFSYLTGEATFPFFTFNTMENFYNNMSHNYINKVDFDPVSFTFLIDTKLKPFKLFFEWMNKMVDDKHRYAFKDEYAGTVEIFLLDNYGRSKMGCKLIDAFPINIDPISLSYASNDEAMKITMSFKFDWIEYTQNNQTLFGSIGQTLEDFSEDVKKYTGDIKQSVDTMIEKAKTIF